VTLGGCLRMFLYGRFKLTYVGSVTCNIVCLFTYVTFLQV